MLQQSLQWLWTTTWQSALLALSVLVIIHLFRNRLQPRWQYALWCIVLLRLAMPFLPSAPWGFLRNGPDVPEEIALPLPAEILGGNTDLATESGPALEPIHNDIKDLTAQAPVTSPETASDFREPSTVNETTISHSIVVTRIIFLFWLCGVAYFATRQLAGEYHLRRMRLGWKRVEDPEILEQLETCRKRVGLRFPVRLYSTPDVPGAGSCGWLRPSILLSETTLARLSGKPLELVLMHELLHHRRRDPLLQRIGLWLGVIHWFNPVMWLTLSQLAKYRETACDAAVLDRLGQSHQQEYGQVVLDFATGLAADRPIPGLVGVFQKNGIKRRIEMIVRHQKTRWYHLALGTGLLLLAAMFGLTKADHAPSPTQEKREAIASEETVTPMPLKTDLPGSGSIELLHLRKYTPKLEEKEIVTDIWSPSGISLGKQKVPGILGSASPWPKEENSLAFTFRIKNMDFKNFSFGNASPELKVMIGPASVLPDGSFLFGTYLPKTKKKLALLQIYVYQKDWLTVPENRVAYNPVDSVKDRTPGYISCKDACIVNGPEKCSPNENGLCQVNAWMCVAQKDIDSGAIAVDSIRVVFISENGEEYPSTSHGRSLDGETATLQYFTAFHGKDAKAESIKAMRLEIRPYRIVEFTDIALYPDQKTSPRVKASPGVFPKLPQPTGNQKNQRIDEKLKTLYQKANRLVASVPKSRPAHPTLYKAWDIYRELRRHLTTYQDLAMVKQLDFSVEDVAAKEAKVAAQIGYGEHGLQTLRFLAEQKKTKKPVSFYARECAKAAKGMSDVVRYFNEYAKELEAKEKGEIPSRDYIAKTYPIGDLVNPLPGVTVAPYYQVISSRLIERHKIVKTSCSLNSDDLEKKIADSFIRALESSTFTPSFKNPWSVKGTPKPAIKFIPETNSLEVTHNAEMHQTIEKRLEWIRRHGKNEIATVTLHFTDLSPQEAGVEKDGEKFNPQRGTLLSKEEFRLYRQQCQDEKKLWKSLPAVTLQLGQYDTLTDAALEAFITPDSQNGAWPCISITTPYKPEEKKEKKHLFFGATKGSNQEWLPSFIHPQGTTMKKGEALLCDASHVFSPHAKKPNLYLLVEVTWEEVEKNGIVE